MPWLSAVLKALVEALVEVELGCLIADETVCFLCGAVVARWGM